MKKAVTFLREMLAIGKQSIVTLDSRSASFGKKIKIRSKTLDSQEQEALINFLGSQRILSLEISWLESICKTAHKWLFI